MPRLRRLFSGVAVFLLLALAGPLSADPVSSEFLLVSPSGRMAAMGSAFTALADDPAALSCNPAGPAIHDRWQMSAGETTFELGQNLNSLFIVYPLEKSGIGLSSVVRHFAFSPGVPVWENGLPGSLSDTYSFAVSAGYARLVREDLAAGASFRYVQESIDGSSARTVAFDLGGLYQIQLRIPFLTRDRDEVVFSRFVKNVRFGLSLQNIGGSLVYEKGGERESLPLRLNAGVHLQPVPFVGIDYQFSSVFSGFFRPAAGTLSSSFGLELFRSYYVIPRIGYTVTHNGTRDRSLSFGAGFKIDYYGLFYQLDYGLKLDTRGLNSTHSFSLTTGVSPSKMKWIGLAALGQREEWKGPDRYQPWPSEVFSGDKPDLTIRRIAVFRETPDADAASRTKRLGERLLKALLSELPDGSEVRFVPDAAAADLVLKSRIRTASNSIRISAVCAVPGASVSSASNFSVDLVRDEEPPPVGSVVFITKDGVTEIMPEKSDVAAEGRQDLLLKASAAVIGGWIARSGRALIPGRLTVETGIDSVNVYVDGRLQGLTGSDGRLAFPVLPGSHRISARKDRYTGQDRDLEVAKGSEQRIPFELKKDFFHSALVVRSSPEGADVFVDGAAMGRTPLRIEKLLNGTYKLRVERSGKRFEEDVAVDRWGYDPSVDYVFDYDSEKADAGLWNPVNREEGIEARVEKGIFVIEGSAREPTGGGSGFVSREFAVSDFEAGFAFRSVSVNGGSLVAGLADDQKNSVYINFDGRYFSIRKSVNGEEKLFVRALDKGKSDRFTLRLRYLQATRQFEALVDDKIIEGSSMKLSGHVRAVLMAGATARNAAVKCDVQRIWIR
jgi:hypothetical protein